MHSLHMSGLELWFKLVKSILLQNRSFLRVKHQRLQEGRGRKRALGTPQKLSVQVPRDAGRKKERNSQNTILLNQSQNWHWLIPLTGQRTCAALCPPMQWLFILLTFHSSTAVAMRCSVWAMPSLPACTLWASTAFSRRIFFSSLRRYASCFR